MLWFLGDVQLPKVKSEMKAQDKGSGTCLGLGECGGIGRS